MNAILAAAPSNGLVLAYSLFPKGAYDNRPKACQGGWVELQHLFQGTWTPNEVRAGDDPKKGLPGISMATFRPRTTRACQNVMSLDGLLVDFDNGMEVETGEFHVRPDGRPTNRPKVRKVCLPDPVHPQEVMGQLESLGVAAFAYTTWSNKPDWPRFRLAVGFANSVPAELWPAALEYALEVLGLRSFVRGIDLPVVRDIARMHFLAGGPEGQEIQRWSLDGGLLAMPLDVLHRIDVPEIPLRPWQETIVRERAATDSNWYQRFHVQGKPVDFRSLDVPRLLRAMGVQVGVPQSYAGGTKWRTHCPWASEHTHGLDDDSGVILRFPGHWPIWRCAHSHHAHMGLRDLLEAYGGVL
ncbi:MAG: hypothetical protein H6Q00_920 [Holophagaceae bacterium]|nr:hypothetical protein [Holophagaceae bacterium]